MDRFSLLFRVIPRVLRAIPDSVAARPRSVAFRLKTEMKA
jgi:hypothetical protein